MWFIMGIDQYGATYHDPGQHPRKELLKRLGHKAASKMYRDKKDGTAVHCGYVIGKIWVCIRSSRMSVKKRA